MFNTPLALCLTRCAGLCLTRRLAVGGVLNTPLALCFIRCAGLCLTRCLAVGGVLNTPLARWWKVAVRVAWSAALRGGPRLASLVRAFALPSRPARSAPDGPLPSTTAPTTASRVLDLCWDGLGAWHSCVMVAAGRRACALALRGPPAGPLGHWGGYDPIPAAVPSTRCPGAVGGCGLGEMLSKPRRRPVSGRQARACLSETLTDSRGLSVPRVRGRPETG
ncbi:hypothetical protein SAMN04488135_103432 [Pollutimonas bauzanensis]|uniref:Uncharacterized protein n=1 Tax=Pollutimonas bauzanensis TaxID=658167 RepID=A0A1M5TNE5_9BURK|nr:hypothetical protein SAMN04488135_103432 [Pollutimonas bauzanensis]